mmetsp:Transcript_27458/g.69321  ORF Transcript_27458/g.69321 Transcript_27458/m.69321 type:complete len:372 (+) Transcript_27458:540-1655(+)
MAPARCVGLLPRRALGQRVPAGLAELRQRRLARRRRLACAPEHVARVLDPRHGWEHRLDGRTALLLHARPRHLHLFGLCVLRARGAAAACGRTKVIARDAACGLGALSPTFVLLQQLRGLASPAVRRDVLPDNDNAAKGANASGVRVLRLRGVLSGRARCAWDCNGDGVLPRRSAELRRGAPVRRAAWRGDGGGGKRTGTPVHGGGCACARDDSGRGGSVCGRAWECGLGGGGDERGGGGGGGTASRAERSLARRNTCLHGTGHRAGSAPLRSRRRHRRPRRPSARPNPPGPARPVCAHTPTACRGFILCRFVVRLAPTTNAPATNASTSAAAGAPHAPAAAASTTTAATAPASAPSTPSAPGAAAAWEWA